MASQAEEYALSMGVSLADGSPDDAVTVRDLREALRGDGLHIGEAWVAGAEYTKVRAAWFDDGSVVWFGTRKWGYTDAAGVDRYNGLWLLGAAVP